MELAKTIELAQQQERLKIDKYMLYIGLAHLPVVMFLAPIGYGTMDFAVIASLIVAAVGLTGYWLLKGTRTFGLLAGVGFMLMSAILIQSQMGRIEMHFHIFVVLAIMLAYRDWLVIIVPAAVIAVHHLLLTWLQLNNVMIGDVPVMLFSTGCGWDVAFLHAVFVVVESAALIYFALDMRKERDDALVAAATIESVSKTGTYNYRVPSQFINVTNDALNSMLAQLESAMGEVVAVLTAYTQRDYSARVKGQFNGDLALLAAEVNTMGARTAERSTQNHDFASQIAAINRSMAVIEFDLTGVIQQANDNFLSATHYQRSEVIGKHHRMFVEPAEANSPSYQTLWDNLAKGLFVSGTFKRIDKAGEIVWLEASYNPILDAQGKPYKVVKFATDITRNAHTLALESAIDESARVLNSIASGDLAQRVQGEYEGRLNGLKSSINSTADKLAEVVANVLEATHVVSSDAEQVAQGATDLSSRASEQTDALAQATQVMQQMNHNASENTVQAQQAALKAESVRAQANEGAAVMSQTIEAMSAIRESSHKISDIVSLIDGIAFQTNLLALNAAVEAARAGEHGRGFAVVASEVRALAGKSADAAKDIKALITDSVSRIEAGTRLADRSGEVLNEIASSVNEVTTAINELAHASVEQAEGIKSVNQAVAMIDRVTHANVAVVMETSASAGSMQAQVGALQQNMAFFKAGGKPSPARALTKLS
ncbi:MAG: PAS domain-containing protein [Proteobacteria bacterium]|nr:PAS domain-containing protein [Pseudomonadota bacterium]